MYCPPRKALRCVLTYYLNLPDLVSWNGDMCGHWERWFLDVSSLFLLPNRCPLRLNLLTSEASSRHDKHQTNQPGGCPPSGDARHVTSHFLSTTNQANKPRGLSPQVIQQE